MKNPLNRRILLASGLCLLLVGLAYFWATGLMDSVYAFRSPLHAAPPTPGEPLGPPLTRQVVFVLIDALREDTSRNAEVMPFLNELRAQGAWAVMHSRAPSYSEPGYTVLLTGAWPDLSDGPAINMPYAEIPTWTQDNLFSAAHRAGLSTAVSGFNWFEKLIPAEAVTAHYFTEGEDQTADRAVVDQALPWLNSGAYAFTLIHIDQVDYAGHHEGGPRDPRWNAAARRADDLLREIVSALDLTRDTVLVVSDHGQIDRGGHGGQDPIVLVEPLVLAGAGVKPGQYGDVQMADVAPTLAALLGTNVPASAQGSARVEMLALSAEQTARLAQAADAQQRQLLTAYQSAIGYSAEVTGNEGVASYQRALDAARTQRLTAERWPRAALALGVLLIGAIGLLRWQRHYLLPISVSVLLYWALFNARYALLDGRTYSLSSVDSADGLILYCALTALIALLVSAAVTWALNARRLDGELMLGLTLAVAGTLGLPILWSFVLNGYTVTWTLPDFASSFLALIALIQLLAVAVSGLVLAGMAAAIEAWRSRP